MTQRLVFMGSDPIALPALNAILSGECGGGVKLVAVYTQLDRARGRGKKVLPNEIKQWALEKGIEVRQPDKIGKAERLEMEALQADACLVMAYGHILSQKFIDTPLYGTWNLHTSLLPAFRGASPIQNAVIAGGNETGVSLMRLVRQMDAGPILDVEKVSIERLDTALAVEHKLSLACVPLVKRCLSGIFLGEAETVPQDEEAATYVRKLGKDDGVLNFAVEAKVLAKRINGLYPWPSARFTFQKNVIKVGLADYEETDTNLAPGTAIGLENGGLRVACSQGIVSLLKLQRAGGKMLDADAFLRGFEFPEGAVLESRSMPQLVADHHFVG
ncbi:methionyl-tRNA formyltransferase [Puniceicoccaceae bacterium K14]|nr:methionyl-tRNA formyltransferase [Puniceicoccaceae bacterium K14]